MATIFDFLVSCPKALAGHADRALSESHQTVARLERELTEFLEESPVHRLNRSRPRERIPFTAAGIELLERSERIRTQSRGSFNCLSKSTGTGEIAWDRQSSEAWRLNENTHLGFGAIGKGYALDQVRVILERAGFHDYVLSGGGSSIILSGFAGPDDPWKWGWSWKKDSGGENLGIPFEHHTGETIAIGISGTHEQGRHILDPVSGRGDFPLAVHSALIAHPSAAEADALSTALFVSGWDKGNSFLAESLVGVSPAVAAIDGSETPRWNGIFQRLWGPVSRISEGMRASAVCAFALSLSTFLCHTAARADDAVDLGAGDANVFAPYMLERNHWWMVLPVFTLTVVLLHLKKPKKTRLKNLIPQAAPHERKM